MKTAVRKTLFAMVAVLYVAQCGCDRTPEPEGSGNDGVGLSKKKDATSDRIERIAKTGKFTSSDRAFVENNISSKDEMTAVGAGFVLSAGVRARPELQSWALELIKERVRSTKGLEAYRWLRKFAKVGNLTGLMWLKGELGELIKKSEDEIGDLAMEYIYEILRTRKVSQAGNAFAKALWNDYCFRSRSWAAEIYVAIAGTNVHERGRISAAAKLRSKSASGHEAFYWAEYARLIPELPGE